MQKISRRYRIAGKMIGIVPTMGFLHQGHEALLRRARSRCDILILTIFVNPTQFGPREDLKRYPRAEKGDLQCARRNHVDFVFMPRAKDIYPPGYETVVEATRASRELCGMSRPDHFRGVATVVAKLFNITLPDIAFFGLKDFQQFAVLKKVAADLNFPIQLVGIPTVRESDGLAMSSRNVYLSPVERKAALCIPRGLKKVKQAALRGEKRIPSLLKILKNEIGREKLARIDYIRCMDAENIQPVQKYQAGITLFAVAVFVGKTRLIDNIVV